MSERMKIAIAVPWSSPFIWTRFTEAAFNVRAPAGTEIRWILGKGWCPARRHTDAIEKALDWGADLVCIFGADQVPAPDLLERLYAKVQQGFSPICALVPSRGYFEHNVGTKPFQPLAWRWSPTKLDENGKPVFRPYRNQELDSDMIELVKPDGEMQVVHIIGSGCIMFHRDHILSLKKPWFSETYDRETYRRSATMDTHFAWRLNVEAGAQLWCDTSIQIGHLTDMMIDETFQNRFDDFMDPKNPTSEPGIVERKTRGAV
jgi:hypothetical protein